MNRGSAVVIDPKDNVATFLREVSDQEEAEIAVEGEVCSISMNENIEFGHKVAIEEIPSGETVYKYGRCIGDATEDIESGDWVHTHNVESNYGRGDRYASSTEEE